MKKIIFIVSLSALFFIGCSEDEINPPEFEVSVEKATFKLSDSITFNLLGNPDDITFYSGEIGRNYENRNSFTSSNGKNILSFVTQTKAGVALPKNLSVLVSTDFNGKYTSDDVKAAKWTNITTRITFPTTNVDVSSGQIDITDLKIADKRLYVAFRYLSDQPTTQAQSYYSIGNFKLVNSFIDSQEFVLTPTVNGAFFKIVDMEGTTKTWTINTAVAASHRLIHLESPVNSVADDDWVISKEFDLTQRNGDVKGSVNVKAISGNAPKTFSWKYTNPGTYKATFIALNTNKNSQKEVVKEVVITIVP